MLSWGQVKAGGPQFDLPHRLFAGDVEDGVAVRDGAAQLQQHGGLAHARLAAEQGRRRPAQCRPPSTRSSSAMPVTIRLFSSVVLMSASRRALRLVTPLLPGGGAGPPGCRAWGLRPPHPRAWCSSCRSWGSAPSSGGWSRRIASIHRSFSVLVLSY